MLTLCSIRFATVAALGALSLLCANASARQESDAGAAARLEVRVLEAQMPLAPGAGEGYDLVHRVEVVSVLSSSFRIKPGEIILLRSSAASEPAARSALRPVGWIGVVRIDRDPKASGAEASSQFVTVQDGDGFEELPFTPPSATWIEYREERRE